VKGVMLVPMLILLSPLRVRRDQWLGGNHNLQNKSLSTA
jgi:hypothetical protein